MQLDGLYPFIYSYAVLVLMPKVMVMGDPFMSRIFKGAFLAQPECEDGLFHKYPPWVPRTISSRMAQMGKSHFPDDCTSNLEIYPVRALT